LNLEPYHQRIYELEGRLNHIEQAYINSDRIRTEYQLQLEALTREAKRRKLPDPIFP
jgi:chromosome segregation ATPase